MWYSFQQLAGTLLFCSSGALALQCHPPNGRSLSLNECLQATKNLSTFLDPLSRSSHQNELRTFSNHDPNSLKAMPRFAHHGDCLISLSIDAPSGTTQTSLDRISKEILQILKQCVDTHHGGGKSLIDDIGITVEHQQRLWRDHEPHSQSAVQPASRRAPDISPVGPQQIALEAAFQHAPDVRTLQPASRPVFHRASGIRPVRLEPVFQEAFGPGARPAQPRFFQLAPGVPPSGLTRQQALAVARHASNASLTEPAFKETIGPGARPAQPRSFKLTPGVPPSGLTLQQALAVAHQANGASLTGSPAPASFHHVPGAFKPLVSKPAAAQQNLQAAAQQNGPQIDRRSLRH